MSQATSTKEYMSISTVLLRTQQLSVVTALQMGSTLSADVASSSVVYTPKADMFSSPSVSQTPLSPSRTITGNAQLTFATLSTRLSFQSQLPLSTRSIAATGNPESQSGTIVPLLSPSQTTTNTVLLFTTHILSPTAKIASRSPTMRSYTLSPSSFTTSSLHSVTQPPHKSSIHVTPKPSPKPSPSPAEATESFQPTENDTEDGTSDYRDLGLAVTSMVVAVVIITTGVLSLSIVGLTLHCRTWRGQRRTRIRGLDRRSDSFRYTQSY